MLLRTLQGWLDTLLLQLGRGARYPDYLIIFPVAGT